MIIICNLVYSNKCYGWSEELNIVLWVTVFICHNNIMPTGTMTDNGSLSHDETSPLSHVVLQKLKSYSYLNPFITIHPVDIKRSLWCRLGWVCFLSKSLLHCFFFLKSKVEFILMLEVALHFSKIALRSPGAQRVRGPLGQSFCLQWLYSTLMLWSHRTLRLFLILIRIFHYW